MRYLAYKASGLAWLGDIPANWEVIPLQYLVKINQITLEEDTPPDFEIEYIDIGSVDETGLIAPPEIFKFKDAPSRARRVVRKNDTLISTVRVYLKAIAFIEESKDNLIASTGFAVLTPRKEYHPKYLYYVLQGHAFINQVSAESKGVNYPAITPSELGRIKLAVTKSLTEQNNIVSFLDSALADINRCIKEEEKLIAFLQEQKNIIVNEAVIRGITPNVEFVPSGIEQLGEVPKHWEKKPARYYFHEVDERSETGEEELLSVSHLTGVTPRSEKNVTMFMAESYEGYKTCQPGDLVINIMWAWMGALGVSEYRGIVSSSYEVYRQKGKFFNWRYLDFLLRTKPYVAEFTKQSTGIHSSRLRMYTDDFFGIPIIRPPLTEQDQIVRSIEKEHAQIDNTLAAEKRKVNFLKEARSIRISEIVTGEIDVQSLKEKLDTPSFKVSVIES